MGSNGSFGFTNFHSFDQCDTNGLNFSHGFRHNKSPLYLNSSSSPSGSQCENSESFCYQNNSSNNNNAHLNNKNLESAHKNYHANNSEVNSRENSPRVNYRADSPEKRVVETCTPDETSRSFSSHRNDGSPSPIHHHNDSVDSQSPENLTSSKSQSNKNPSVNDMLDHKLQLSFLGPPLAALHSMTEMKSQTSPKASQHSQSQCVTNPHGIDSILSRPTPVTSAHLNAALGGILIT